MTTRNRVVVVTLLVLTAGCAPDITETDFYSMHPGDAAVPGAIEIARFTDQGVEVVLKTEAPLADGPNRITVSFGSGGTNVTGQARLDAVYTTPSAEIASPFAAGETNGDGDAAVVLLAPVGVPGTWSIRVDWEAAGRRGSKAVDIEGAPSNRVRYDAALDVYATWLAPAVPHVGDDEVTFALHRFTGSAWAPVTNAALDLYPYMDMGGGEGHSTPYEAPAHTSGGLYAGRINFIMSGGWDLTLLVTLGTQAPASLHFDDFTVR